jgi:hypothetical protein
MAALALVALVVGVSPGEAGQKKKKAKIDESTLSRDLTPTTEPPSPPDCPTPPSEAPACPTKFADARVMLEILKVAGDLSKTADESEIQAKVVDELIHIMNETKSPQTLLATAMALMPMGKKAQPAVPAIIRNAERLKMLQPLKDVNSAKADNASLLLTAVMAIQMDLTFTKEMLGIPGGDNPLQRCVVPPACYPPATPPGPYYYYNSPWGVPQAPTAPYNATGNTCPPSCAPPCPTAPLPGFTPNCPLSAPPPPAVAPSRPATNPTPAPAGSSPGCEQPWGTDSFLFLNNLSR